MFYLFTLIFAIVIFLIDFFTPIKVGQYGILGVLYAVIILIPSISAVVRRLHDVNKSGWMFFINLIPIVGGIWLFILMVTDGTSGDNEYGPNPKLINQNPDSIVNNTNI